MKNAIQYIEKRGKPQYAIVPIDIWEEIKERAEMADDLVAYQQAKANDDGFRIPGAVVFAELDGIHAVNAWRTERGLTLDALAEKSGLSKAYLSQIESRKRAGTTKTMRAIAKALNVPLDVLVD
jgi:antitoxin component HigA of HigAB toxin-antitoxin module